jgi:hypothetical protein
MRAQNIYSNRDATLYMSTGYNHSQLQKCKAISHRILYGQHMLIVLVSIRFTYEFKNDMTFQGM